MEQATRRIIRNFIFELLIYGGLVFLYFLVVLRLLGEPLTRLYHMEPPTYYAVVALVLIVAQGVVLEYITSFLLRLLGLEQLE